MRDKLKRRFDTSAGLTTDLIKFFLKEPQHKNLPLMSMAGSPSFTPVDKTRMREALQTFSKNLARTPNSGLFNAVVGAHFAKSQSWVAQAEICEKQSSKLTQFYNLALTDESVHVQT